VVTARTSLHNSSSLNKYTNSTPISEDCAPGTCYEGACAGDSVYSTDGTCGTRGDSLRMCAGKWGDCCNLDGFLQYVHLLDEELYPSECCASAAVVGGGEYD